MLFLKGFVTISEYVNNEPGKTSLLGELSTLSRTYSREKGEYSDISKPGYRLVTFRCNDENNVKITVPKALTEQILSLVIDCIVYAKSHIRPYDSDDFKNTILTTYYQKISDIQFGQMIDNGTLALPEWISWTSLETPDSVVKIWLSDNSFQEQYDDTEIIVIPPIDTVDNFFHQYNLAMNEVRDVTSNMLSDKINVAKDGNPETFIRLLDFDYHNVLSVDQKNKTTWSVIIYGKAGDNIDSIKDAIVEYILANSVRSRDQWEIIFPDIFKRTEFVILPRWNKVSIENLTNLSSLYSSIVDPSESIDFAKNAISFYPQDFIGQNVTVLPYDYKAVSLVVVNGMGNVEESNNLYKVIPDYIPVPSTSSDFN